MTILILETDKFHCQLYLALLDILIPDAVVIATTSSEEAIRLHTEHNPDGAIIGFQLEDGTSVPYLQYVRCNYPMTPIVGASLSVFQTNEFQKGCTTTIIERCGREACKTQAPGILAKLLLAG